MISPEGSTVTFRRVPPDVRPRALLNFARKLEREVSKGRTFDCLISGDAELRRLNREFRGKDEATDVLSFPIGPQSDPAEKPSLPRSRGGAEQARRKSKSRPEGAEVAESAEKSTPDRGSTRGARRHSEPGPEGTPSGSGLGDLAISLARARTQGREFGHTTEQEVRVLMLHGLLHLLDMDHETDGGQMARAEKRWRARLGLPDGLIERVRP